MHAIVHVCQGFQSTVCVKHANADLLLILEPPLKKKKFKATCDPVINAGTKVCLKICSCLIVVINIFPANKIKHDSTA